MPRSGCVLGNRPQTNCRELLIELGEIDDWAMQVYSAGSSCHDCVASMFAALLFALCISAFQLAAEPWADALAGAGRTWSCGSMPPTPRAKRTVADNAELKEWRDASGKGRTSEAAGQESSAQAHKGWRRHRPLRRHRRPPAGHQTGREAGIVYVFIVASPRQNIGAFRAFLALNAAERTRLHQRLEHRPWSVAPRRSSRYSTSKAAASAALKTCSRANRRSPDCTRSQFRRTPKIKRSA